MAVYSETIKLDDQVSKAAAEAAQEVKVLESATKSVQNALVKAQALGNIGGFKKASQQMGMLKIATDQAKTKLAGFPPVTASVTNSLEEIPKATTGASSGLGAMQAELAAVTGGLSVVVGIIASVVAGFAALTYAGAAFAISCSEAKDASISLFSALGQGKINGEEVDEMLDELRKSTGLTKDTLAPMTTAFLKMGITGKSALEGLTTAAASAEALAKGGADAFTTMWQQANAAAETGSKLVVPFKKLQNQLVAIGLNVDDLAKEMNMSSEALTAGLKKGTIDAAKFGDALENAVTKKGVGPLQTLANSSKNLGNILHEYIGDLFEDMGKDIAPFMAEVKALFEIFSTGKESGSALKVGIGGFFKEVFAIATKVVPMVKHFMLDLIIYGLKAYIALKPVVKWFDDLKKNEAFMNKLGQVFEMLKMTAIAIGVAIAAVIIIFVAMWATMVAIGVAVWTLIATFVALVNSITQIVTGLVISAYKWGSDFVAGLVNGITAGYATVTNAVTGLADKAKNAFKNALGIQSPSKDMFVEAKQMGAGIEGGLEASESGVAKASSDLAGAAKDGFSDHKSSGGSSSSGGGVTVNVEPGAIVIQGGSGASIVDLTEQAVALLFERVALANGL